MKWDNQIVKHYILFGKHNNISFGSISDRIWDRYLSDRHSNSKPFMGFNIITGHRFIFIHEDITSNTSWGLATTKYVIFRKHKTLDGKRHL